MSIIHSKKIWLSLWLILFWGISAAEEQFPVKTMKLEKKTVQPVVTAYGILEEDKQMLYFETDGYLTKLLATEGEIVKKGQLLAKLDAILIDNQIAQIQQALQNAKNKLKRAKKLKNRQVVTQDELEDREYNYSIKLLELERAKEQQIRHFLYTPVKGKILKRLIDFAGPVNSTTAIFTLKSLDKPWIVTAQLTEQEVLVFVVWRH